MILLIPLLLILHLLLLSQLTFTAWPEMLSYPYLVVNGFSPYKDFVMPYPPGLILFLGGVFQIFGFRPEVLKILTWILILTADILMYVVLRKTTSKASFSLMFLVFFIFLQSFLDGNMLWFDFATVIPLLAAFWFVLRWLEKDKNKNLFLISFCLTSAILIKQVAAIYFLAFGLLYCRSRGIKEIRKIRVIIDLWVLSGGILILIIPLAVYLASNGLLEYFWNWTLFYPLTEWSNFPGYVQMALTLKQKLFILLLVTPVLGIFICIKRLLKDKIIFTGLMFLIAALIAIYPRFSYFHLQPTLPFLILLSARIYTLISLPQRLFYGSLVATVVLTATFLLGPKTWGEGTRFYDEGDKKLARQVSSEVRESERVFLQGINSSVYVYANRLPPPNWSDNFGWYLEIPGVSEWAIKGFEKNPPKKVFWRVPQPGKWYELGTYQPRKITEYFRQYYIKTGKINEGIEIWTKKD